MDERTLTARPELAVSTITPSERHVGTESTFAPTDRRVTTDAHGIPRPASVLAFVMLAASVVPRLGCRRPEVPLAPTPYAFAATAASCRVPSEACLGRHRAVLRHARARGTPRLVALHSRGLHAPTGSFPAFSRGSVLISLRLLVEDVTCGRTSSSIRRKEAVTIGILANGVCISPPRPPNGGGPAARRIGASCPNPGRAPGTGPVRGTSLRLLRHAEYHAAPQTPLVSASPRIWRPGISSYREVLGEQAFRRPPCGLKSPPSASVPCDAAHREGAADQTRPQWKGSGGRTAGHVRPGLLPGALSGRIGLRPPASASILHGPAARSASASPSAAFVSLAP